jgi:Holliday junction resolvasome RuvABC endonuclease subunit
MKSNSLLAIDPGSNKCGVAFFSSGVLIAAKTIISDKASPLERRLDMAVKLDSFFDAVDEVTSEEPLLLGRNNNGMQRLLGCIEYLTQGKVSFIHPMTLKAFMGTGKADKLDMALAAGEMVQTPGEQEILAGLIRDEDFDATDAVCVGLAYLKRKSL